PRDAGDQPLMQGRLPQSWTYGLHVLPGQLHGKRSLVQHQRDVPGLRLREATRDHAPAARDGGLDRGSGFDLPVQNDGELLADELLGDRGELARTRRVELELD